MLYPLTRAIVSVKTNSSKVTTLNTPSFSAPTTYPAFPFKEVMRTCLAVNTWVGISQLFRYFVIVVPMMRAAFPNVEDIVPITWPVVIAWGVWVTIYLAWFVSIIWIFFERFGTTVNIALIAGSMATIPVYGLFWLALYLMSLTTPMIILIALPLAWIELLIAAMIIRSRMIKQYETT